MRYTTLGVPLETLDDNLLDIHRDSEQYAVEKTAAQVESQFEFCDKTWMALSEMAIKITRRRVDDRGAFSHV